MVQKCTQFSFNKLWNIFIRNFNNCFKLSSFIRILVNPSTTISLSCRSCACHLKGRCLTKEEGTERKSIQKFDMESLRWPDFKIKSIWQWYKERCHSRNSKLPQELRGSQPVPRASGCSSNAQVYQGEKCLRLSNMGNGFYIDFLF